MKEITTNLELDADNQIAEISNSNNNDSWIALYKVGKAIVYVENLEEQNQFFLTGHEVEQAKKDPHIFLETELANFDFSDGYPFADLEWGTIVLEDLKASPEDDGPFKIIQARYLSNSSTINSEYRYLQDDQYSDVEFETYSEAKVFLDKWGSGRYYLQNNEIEGSDYIIFSN